MHASKKLSITAISMIFVVAMCFSVLMLPSKAYADVGITIDGDLSDGEWGDYFWFEDNSEGPGPGYNDDPLPIFRGYITFDSENLYLAFDVEDTTPNTNRDFLYVYIDIPPAGEFNEPVDALYWGSTPDNPSFFGEAYLTSGGRSQRGSTWGTDGGVVTARNITKTIDIMN